MFSKCLLLSNNITIQWLSYSKLLCISFEILAFPCLLPLLTMLSSSSKEKSEVMPFPMSSPLKLISKDPNNSLQRQTGGQMCCPVSQLQFLMNLVLIISSFFFFFPKPPIQNLLLLLSSSVPLRLGLPLFPIHASTACSSGVCQCALGGLLAVVV